jgi:hypothetical protein
LALGLRQRCGLPGSCGCRDRSAARADHNRGRRRPTDAGVDSASARSGPEQAGLQPQHLGLRGRRSADRRDAARAERRQDVCDWVDTEDLFNVHKQGILSALTQAGYIDARSRRKLVYAIFLRDVPLSPDFHQFFNANNDQGAIAAACQQGY